MSAFKKSRIHFVFVMAVLCAIASAGCRNAGRSSDVRTESVGVFAIDGRNYHVMLDRGLGWIADSRLRILDESRQVVRAIQWDDRFERLPVQVVGSGLEARIDLGPGGSFSAARVVKRASTANQTAWLLDVLGEEDCITFARIRAEAILAKYQQDGSQSLHDLLDDVSAQRIERLPHKILRSAVGPIHNVWLGEAANPSPSLIKYWECAVPVTVWDGEGNAHKFDLNFRGFDFDGAPGNLYQVWTGDRLPAFEVAMRTRMLQASKRQDPNFPDGEQKKLTQFAYIGDVDANGKLLHVVSARSVIPKMLAPRGQAWLAFYDANDDFVGAHSIDVFSPPLWCEGSRVYFSGLQTNGEQSGNALDLSKGFANRHYVRAPVPGSWIPTTADQTAAGN